MSQEFSGIDSLETQVQSMTVNRDEPVTCETLQHNAATAKYPSRGAYELKFLLNTSQNEAVRDWARKNLNPDPHVSPTLGDSYEVNSLYLDTPNFDVFHRADGFRQSKYRLRRYGSESVVWLELKRKEDGRVRKRRTSVADGEIGKMLHAPADLVWPGSWFQSRRNELQLQPVCQVTYQRFATIGTSTNGPIRLTIDSNLRCQPTSDWSIPNQPLAGDLLLSDQQILELKFHETIPSAFRDLIQKCGLTFTSFSKYRQSVEACISLERLMGKSL